MLSSRTVSFNRDVTPEPHFLTSPAVLVVFWMKTANDVTLEPIFVTSLSKKGIKDGYPFPIYETTATIPAASAAGIPSAIPIRAPLM